LVDLGWTGLPLPEEHGGVGAGFLEACLVIEELGRACVPSPYLPTVCAGLAISRHGDSGQREDWLPAIAKGRVVAYGRAAPGARWGAQGSDVAAEPADGDGVVLDGTALFVPYAGGAEDLLVVARHGESHQLTVVLADAASPGIKRRRLEVVGGAPTDHVEFARVPVPGERVLAPPDAVAVVRDITEHATAAVCAEMVGGAQAVLDMTVAHAGRREQFGKPIGSFQAVQHLCADMAIDVLSARLITYEAVWRLAEGHDAAEEVSVAKAWASEAYERVCAAGHQVHGAIGFTAEHPLHRHTRHAMASANAFGDADFHTELLARRLGI
jgi:alkylation response protein AidB-like acyl-CoA dehydrogenase